MAKDGSIEEGDAQRARILKISADLFAAKGFQAVGVAEIGDSVGLGRGALYYHIGSKEELLYDIAVAPLRSLVAAGKAILRDVSDPPARIVGLSRSLVAHVAADKAALTVCFRDGGWLTGTRHASVARSETAYRGLWAEACEDGARRGVFRRLPPLSLDALLGMYVQSVTWLEPRAGKNPEAVADMLSDIVLRALAPEAKTTRRR